MMILCVQIRESLYLLCMRLIIQCLLGIYGIALILMTSEDTTLGQKPRGKQTRSKRNLVHILHPQTVLAQRLGVIFFAVQRSLVVPGRCFF